MKICIKQLVDPCSFEPYVEEHYYMEAGERVRCLDAEHCSGGLVKDRVYIVAEDQIGPSRLMVHLGEYRGPPGDYSGIGDYYRFRFKPIVRVKANRS